MAEIEVTLKGSNRFLFFVYFILFIYLFWLHCAACGLSVPRPGIEPTPPAVEGQSLNHWTAREVPE